jgi:CRP-like cAMP-binding protein
MISPELLRRYPVFGSLDDEQLKKVSMITEEERVENGTTIFNEGDPANTLYILVEGAVDLFYRSEEEYHPKNTKEFSVGEINPGEVFSISALIEPYKLGATARTVQDCRILKVDAVELRKLCREDQYMAYKCMNKITSALMERLKYARVQLAASQN